MKSWMVLFIREVLVDLNSCQVLDLTWYVSISVQDFSEGSIIDGYTIMRIHLGYAYIFYYIFVFSARINLVKMATWLENNWLGQMIRDRNVPLNAFNLSIFSHKQTHTAIYFDQSSALSRNIHFAESKNNWTTVTTWIRLTVTLVPCLCLGV